MARYAVASLGGGGGHGSLLRPETLTEMFQPRHLAGGVQPEWRRCGNRAAYGPNANVHRQAARLPQPARLAAAGAGAAGVVSAAAAWQAITRRR